MNIELNLDTVIQRNENDFLANSIGDEVVIMNTETGDYLSINTVGSDIWNMLKQPIKIIDLINQVQDLYDIDREKCIDEVNAFLNNMIEQKIVTIKKLK